MEEELIYRSDETLKKFLPTYLSSMEKHYESPAPAVQYMSKFSPRDLHRTWEEASYEPTLKRAIWELAPSVVSVSYFTGFQRKVDCSGFIIDWDDSKGIATVLTSAKLMRSPSKRDNYYIIVRLANGKMLLAQEDYVDYYHNIVTFKVNSDAKLRPLNLSPLTIQEDNEVVALARDFYTCKLSESCGLLRPNHPYFGCEQLLSSTCRGGQAGEGGPLITKAGQIIGINFFDGHQYVHPLPTSVIKLCLENWESHGIVMQPWLGFTAIDISNLPLDTYEFSYDSSVSVVVKEVYKGSPADKVGVRSGDSINAVNELELYSGLQEYSNVLNEASHMLSACRPNQTERKVFVRVNGNILVHAENLSVNHKNFCSCWLGGESDWTYMMPLTGSQTRRAYDIGHDVNVSFEPLGVVTDAGSDTANDDVVPMYSER